mgnify:CR=1 FL=1
MLRFLTAGESHGRALMAILEGMPAGLKVNKEEIDFELFRRQSGYGRGARMGIEKDRAQIISGLHKGLTIASPIGILIENKDSSIDSQPPVYNPRPAHADLPGALKYGFSDCRDVLERASARETAVRVAIGALCKIFLKEFNVRITSKTLSVGGASGKEAIIKAVDEAIRKKDTLGGIFEVTIEGVPAGLGSYVQGDRRLNARLACGIMSIPAIKGVEFGLGFGYAAKSGAKVNDAIYFSKDKGYFRKSNNAGGIEGGMSNGSPIIIRCCMKPIATLGKPLASVDMNTKKPVVGSVQRADIAAVEAAGVVAEAVCAFQIADSFLEKFGGDAVKDIKQAFSAYLKRINR